MTNTVERIERIEAVSGSKRSGLSKSKQKLIILASVLLLAAAIAFAIGTDIFLRGREADAVQAAFLEKLELSAGKYAEETIVLSGTNKYQAEVMAKKLGARLRITENGHFAVLYLPDGNTVADVAKDASNVKYLPDISLNYYVKAADVEETEVEEYVPLPTMPSYDNPDPYFSQQQYLNYLNFENAMNDHKGKNLKIAIIDSGIDTDHPEFAGRISDYSYNASSDMIVRDWNDWSLIEDVYGHGTAVAGVISAANNGSGINGICPEAELIVIKADCDDKGEFQVSDLVFGLYYAIERDVDVVNMSFALPSDDDKDPFEDAAQLACDSDIICVAASGNKSSPGTFLPASNKNVVGVGSLEEDSWELASYSNFGENNTVVAPGTVLTTVIGGGYGYMKGTSFSAPIVSSVALMYKQWFGPYETNEKFLNRLHASCRDLGDLGPDFFYGYGAVDVNALLHEPTGTVTYNMMTDELDNVDQLFIHDHPIQDVLEPERLYAVFDGWYYDPQFTEELNWYEDKYNSNITLYAKWANEDDMIPFNYRILEDDTVEILGYKGKRRFITIPDYIEGRQVSSIGRAAFAKETRLRRILLPHYLKNIGDKAFFGCSNIVTFALPTGVETIGESAFENCVKLTSLSLGNSVSSIGEFAFKNCALLKSIYLPATVRSVNGTAFAGCASLNSILVDEQNNSFIAVEGSLYNKSKSILVAHPAALTAPVKLRDETDTIGIFAFYGSSVLNVDFSNVQRIEASAFENSSILSADLPDTCEYVGDSAFHNSYLMSLNISRSMTEINFESFASTSLVNLFIPKNIKVIGEKAFEKAGIYNIQFEEGSELFLIDGWAFAGNPMQGIAFPPSLTSIQNRAFSGCAGLYDVSFGSDTKLQEIGDFAFSDTISLKSINLPGTLRKIGWFCFSGSGLVNEVQIPASVSSYGYGAFATCYQLSAIRVAAENEMYTDIDGVVYSKNLSGLVEYPAGKSATEYEPLDSVETIAAYAFYGNKVLMKITMPDSVKFIGDSAFQKCTYISSYRLSESLEYVGQYAFSTNLSLRYLYIPDSVIQLSRFAFADSLNLETIVIRDESHIKRLGMQVFANCGLTEFRIPASVSTVAQYAFEGCTRLRRIVFAGGSDIESISAYFFNGCTSIETIEFEYGSKIKSIQAHGFNGLTNLKWINFGDASIENIDNYAFRNCPSLESIELPDTVVNIGRFAFYRCASLKSLTVPEGIEHIGEFAFLGTDKLELYFKAETLPIYLEDNWDAGISGYYTGVTETQTDGDWKYAVLSDGSVAILKYSGSEKHIDLSSFAHGSVRIIGGYAFAYTEIESVVLPSSVEQIQRYAFAECGSLGSLTIPSNVTFIGQYAFYRTGIQSLEFESGTRIKVIEQYAFSGDRNLKNVVIPGSIEKLGQSVFYQSGLEAVTFASDFSLTTIPENAFAETKLRSVRIPDSVTLLDHNAFSHNLELKTVEFGNSADLMIMSNVFYYTGLTSVQIGKNVSFVGEYAFMDLENLTAFEVDPDNPYYSVEDGVLYNKDKTKLIAVPSGKTGSFTISKDIEIIGFGAFENSKLSEITFENGSSLVTLGYRAFYGAKNLTSVTIPKSVVSIDYYAFAECDKLKTVLFEEGNRLSGIYEGAFFGCRSLENILLPDAVVEISPYAFYACESLDKLPLSDDTSVLYIGDYAFAYTAITELDLPGQLYDIGKFAFRGIQIKELTIKPDDVRVLRIGIGAFADCDRIETVTLPFTGESIDAGANDNFGFIFGSDHGHYDPEFVPEVLRSITITDQKIFNYVDGDGKVWYSFYRLSNVETVVLPEDTYFIGPETFSYFSSLREFDLPYLLTSIERFTFDSCFNLKEIYLPEGIEYIGTEAFAFCRSLETVKLNDGLKVIMDGGIYGQFRQCPFEEIYLPDSLTFIGSQSFQECVNLKSVDIPASALVENSEDMFRDCVSLEHASVRCGAIGNGMFANCVALRTVVITGDVKRIGSFAFNNCELLAGFAIPEHVESIGESAFSGCRAFKVDLNLPEGLTTIGRYAFDMSGITSLVWPSSLTEVGDDVFRFCDNLRSIEIKAPLKVFPNVFYNSGSLVESVVMPDSIEEIASGAFSPFAKLHSIKLPESLRIIGLGAFSGCSGLKEIELPENLTVIGDDAFTSGSIRTIINHSALQIGFEKGDYSSNNYGGIGTSATLIIDKYGEHYPEEGNVYLRSPEGLLFRDEGGVYSFVAYHGDSDVINVPSEINGVPVIVRAENIDGSGKKLILPEGLEEAYIFAQFDELVLPSTFRTLIFDEETTSINTITVSPDNGYMRVENGLLIVDDRTVFCTESAGTAIVVPAGVKEIGDHTFLRRKIRSVVLPESLISIGENAFRECRELTSVILPLSLREVKFCAFTGCTSLREISFGGCESIGGSAFSGCVLETIVIPGSIKKISDEAFSGNQRVREVILEEGVEEIGASAFCNTTVMSVSLPGTLKKIGDYAFASCGKLESVYIPAGVESIGQGAFNGISEILLDDNNTHFALYDDILYNAEGTAAVWATGDKTEFHLLPSLTEVSSGLFRANQQVKSVILPEGVKKICSGAFVACQQLESIVIPETLECIEDGAFDSSGLKEIYLPSSLKTLGDHVFQYIAPLIRVSPDNPYFFMQEGVLYAYKDDGIHALRGTKETPDTVVLPDGVTVICGSAFENTPIKKIVFPESLDTIEGNAFTWSKLEEIVWSHSVRTIWDGAFGYTKLKELIFPESLEYALRDPGTMEELEKLYIPSGIVNMETQLRSCPKLKEIVVSPDNDAFFEEGGIVYSKSTNEIVAMVGQLSGTVRIRNGVTKIKDEIFKRRSGLSEVFIPDSVTQISGEAFAETDIAIVHIPSSVTYIEENVFKECFNLIIVENDSNYDFAPHCSAFPNSLVVFNRGVLSEGTVDGWHYYLSGDYVCSEYTGTDDVEHKYRVNAYLGDLEDITIPTVLDGRDVVPYLFEPFHATTVRIAEGVTKLNANAFTGSTSLRRVILPDTVREFETGWYHTRMNAYVIVGPFAYSSITEINIPNGFLSIDGTFEECHNLSKVSLPEGLLSIGRNTFYRCYALKTIQLPNSLRTIGGGSFDQSGIESVVFPPNIETIDQEAFIFSNVRSVVIPDSIEYIGNRAFDITPLTSITLPDKEFYIGADAFGGLLQGTYPNIESNWDGDFLYAGNHLLMYRGNDPYVCVERDVKSIATNAFEGCSRVRYLEIPGYASGSLRPEYLTNLEMLIIRRGSKAPIRDYFTVKQSNGWSGMDVPDTLKSIVIKRDCYIEHTDELWDINDIFVFVEGTKAEAPFDRIAPGWNNNNTVTYGDKWYMAKFYDHEGKTLSCECFRNSQAIRPPYVVLPRSGDTAYKHIGWDLDGDGQPDGMPASRLSDVEAYAVVETSKPAFYTVKFMDIDRKAVIQETILEYGQLITPPATLPSRTGYVFAGWENFEDGDKVSENIKIYSVWNHLGDGHNYVTTIVPPTCTDRGYTLHKCSICGDEFRSDYVDETWHSFGEWIVDKPSSCSVHGERHRVCETCGFVENAILASEGHAYNATVIREATCTEFGIVKYVCSVCSDTVQDSIAMKPHEYREVLADKGYIEWLDHEFSGIVWGCSEDKTSYWYYTCEHCGKIETVAAAAASSVGSNHRHEWTEILNDAGENVAVKCSLCGEVECFRHDYECTEENGKKKFKCKNCGHEYEELTEFIITFVDWDERVISQTAYHYGDTVTIPSDPSRPADNVYTYTFAGWTPSVSEVTVDATYKATYTSTYIDYTVRFVDYDGSLISEETYHYGDTITVPGNPVRPADETYSYSFNGWDKDITACYGSEVYTATYKSTYIEYLIRFVDYDGRTISENHYHYGDSVTVPVSPSRLPDETYTYAFTGWDKPVTEVRGNETYTAQYKPTYIDYTVRFVNYDGSVISEKTYHYGDTVTVPSDPTRSADNTYTYTFKGWDKVITAVKGNETYTATYDAVYIEYTVRFVDYDDSLISEGKYHYGDTVTAPANPTRESDNEYTYTFNGWDQEITLCYGNKTYRATYTTEQNVYTVTFKNDDGSVIAVQTYHYGDTVTPPSDPVKNADATYTYAFSGWTPAITKVIGNTVYTATYQATYIDYTVKFLDYDGSVISEKTYHYGDSVTVPASPSRLPDETYTYAFTGWDKPVTEVRGNETYTAQYKSTYIDYTVRFVNYDGSVISEKTYHYGDTVTVPSDPTRSADNTYTYTFKGWDKVITAVKGNETYTATYGAVYIEYTVRFVDYDDSLISEGKYHYGDTVTAPANPTRESDNEYTYTFNGWDQEITLCYGNKTYRATYTTEQNVYTVTFKNDDGSVIAVQTYHYGDTVTPPSDPVKNADATYTYAFSGWTPAITKVIGNTVYTATYQATYIDYTVRFLNDDGTVLSEKTYHYGETVQVPDTPAKNADNTYTYVFDGWDKDITVVKGNVDYTATYKAVYIEYTVRFVNDDGTVLSEKHYHYSDTVEEPAAPTKLADKTYIYTFKGWDKPIEKVSGNTTYTATYTQTYVEYTIRFVNYDGSVISEKNYHYGDTVTVPSDPTRLADNTYTYSFAGWDKTVTTVTESTVYTATYSSTYIEYTVRFVDYDSRVISENKYHYGDTVAVPENPTREKDGQYTYTFAGWDQEITLCYGDKTYRATYTTDENVYTVTFKNDDGSVIAVQTYHYGDTVTPPSDPAKNADMTYTYAFSGWTPSIAKVTGNAVYTATYQAAYIDYTVRFLNDDGTVLTAKTYHYGETVLVPDTPTKNADETYIYVFAGWDKDITVVNGNVDYTATYTAVFIEYTVRFVNDDGTLLSEKQYHYGETVEEPAAPTKAADKTYTYTFKGWDKPVAKVSCNETYTAAYAQTYIDYTVRFVNYDGSVISEKTYHYGDIVTVPSDPTRSADNTYSYTFAGWDKTITAVTESTVYTATYSSTYIEYTVRFVDYDDSLISEGKYHYGDTVTAPANPTRASDNEHTYTFSGWDQEITLCYGNKTYRATYTTDENVYTVTFRNDSGAVIAVQIYHYGDTVTPPSDPVKNADETYTYAFSGWAPAITKVNGDAAYTATYQSTFIEYTIRFLDDDGTVLSEKKYHFGDSVREPAHPTKVSDQTYTYAFKGWDKPVDKVSGDATYIATYSETFVDYTVRFLNYNGTLISEKTYHYGDRVSAPSDPERMTDKTYRYTFTGWTPEIKEVTGNTVYTAVYRSEYIDYTVKFLDWDGKVLSEKAYHYNDAVTAPEDPVRAAGDKYEYEFKGWNPAIASVTADAEYRAEYTEKAKTPAYKLGDVNGDGRVNAADYLLLKRIILRTAKATEEQSKRLDINGDGTVRANDYMLLKRIVLGTLAKP